MSLEKFHDNLGLGVVCKTEIKSSFIAQGRLKLDNLKAMVFIIGK